MPSARNPQDEPLSPAVSGPRFWRSMGVFALKALVASLLLYWLATSGRLDFSHFRDIPLSPHTAFLVTAGVGAVWVGILLLGLRLRLMVHAVGIELSLSRACSLTAIGLFSGSILPGVVGGDVVKVVYLYRGEGARHRTLATVAVVWDRAVGLFSLFLLGSLVLVAGWPTEHLPFRSPVLFIAPAVVLLIAAVVVVLGKGRLFGNFCEGRWGALLSPRLRKAVAAGDDFARRPRLLAKCIGLSLVNHALVCSTFLIAAKLLGGIDVPPVQQFMLNPLAMVINVVPITPGGVGVTESAFSYLYEAAGCALGASIGILGRSIQYLAYVVVGFPALTFRRFRTGVSDRD